MIRIVIADDHELIREGLKKVLLWHNAIEISGEAANLGETLDVLARVTPDVLVLDIGLNETSDWDGLLYVRARFPNVPVLVLSMHSEERYAVRSLRAGASGYLCKANAIGEVVPAIEKIAAGGRYVSPLVAELLAEEIATPNVPPHRLLTRREAQVLHLLGAGMVNKQVAARLCLSVSSVNTYRSRIFSKMNLTSHAALIHYAVKHSLV
jgi:two-component system invasion response regulator UvrY